MSAHCKFYTTGESSEQRQIWNNHIAIRSGSYKNHPHQTINKPDHNACLNVKISSQK